MTTAKQIVGLTDRIRDELVRAADYYNHTQLAWRLVQQVYKEKVTVHGLSDSA